MESKVKTFMENNSRIILTCKVSMFIHIEKEIKINN
jgi:hypothetical protein